MKVRRKPVVVLMVLGFGLSAGADRTCAQTLVNGSFEQSGGSFTGWSTIGATSIVGSSVTSPTNGSFQAFISNNAAGAVSANSSYGSNGPDIFRPFFNNAILPVDSIGRVATNGSGISKTFTVGAASTLSFDYKSVTNEQTDSKWDIVFYYVDGTVTILPNPDVVGANPNYNFGVTVGTDPYSYGYTYQTINIQLSAGTHTIGFGVYNTGDESVNSGLFIDNLTLVPEPEAYALLGGGLAMMALAGWRRRRAAR